MDAEYLGVEREKDVKRLIWWVKEQWSYTLSDTFVFYLFVDNLMLI